MNGVAAAPATRPVQALRVVVTGQVQGVGFRPFVHRLATHYGLSGQVHNDAGQVEIVACGEAEALRSFLAALIAQAPPLARPRLGRVESIAPLRSGPFRIAPSTTRADRDAHLPADRYACADCLRELFDPADRRYRYPFINCTQCGPRYTVIRDLPYDRAATSMAGFALCAACRTEYEDPTDRRFHAEPLACPVCGPRLQFVGAGRRDGDTAAALAACVAELRAGRIVAVKGIGGYHLMCDARNDAAVHRLRERKARPHKPLAVMFPTDGPDGLAALRRDLDPDPVEAAALLDPARPIVLVRQRVGHALSPRLAPGLVEIGAFLPYSPLHALLLHDFGAPLVATSGNLSGEPVLTDEREAAQRLAPVADAFLHHDRPIVRPADDPVQRVVGGRARPIRLGRGTAPLECELGVPLDAPVLALGGESKVTLALGFGRRLVLSPHIGNLDSPRGRRVFASVAADLQQLYGVTAVRLLADAHPGYASRRWARATGLPVSTVLHHHAHASAVAWERPDVRRWLVFAWDGVGLGDDASLWGGEALLGVPGAWRRAGSLVTLRPPGGERAAREPWRSAAALCWATGREFDRPAFQLDLARAAWGQGLNSMPTSAVGRLFDAAACLLLGIDTTSFEAQAPMQLEALACSAAPGTATPLPQHCDAHGVWRIDWRPLLDRLLDTTVAPPRRAADFHATLAQAALAQAQRLHEHAAFEAVGLGGGVFQNRLLCDEFAQRFGAAGFELHLPGVVPVNDAGLAFGQVVEAAARQNAPGPRP
ncbi:MAG: carbamoyltransferase HypF [Burkholderiales bacterium]|nr:carbamoyltransferase HypF [Burkholderiales bacterium]